MSTAGIIFIIYFSTLLIGLFFLIVIKGYYHFEYLKEVYPDKLKKYSSIFETFGRLNNEYAFLMIFPTFKRLKNAEKSQKTIKLGNATGLICRLIYIDLIVIVVTVFSMILIYGD